MTNQSQFMNLFAYHFDTTLALLSHAREFEGSS